MRKLHVSVETSNMFKFFRKLFYIIVTNKKLLFLRTIIHSFTFYFLKNKTVILQASRFCAYENIKNSSYCAEKHVIILSTHSHGQIFLYNLGLNDM